MSEERPSRPLVYEDDDTSIYDLIQTIGHGQGQKLLSRPTKHHIKYGVLNFFPSTGAITVDGAGRHLAAGSLAFEELVLRQYPEPLASSSPRASVPSSEPAYLKVDDSPDDEPKPTILDLGLGLESHEDDGSVPW